jgi:hypothetical protein
MSTIFSRLAEGPEFRYLVRKAEIAQYGGKNVLLEEDRAKEILPAFGFTWEVTSTYRRQTDGVTHAWKSDFSSDRLLRSLVSAMEDAVQQEGLEDGSLRQWIDGQKLDATIQQVMAEVYRYAEEKRPLAETIPMFIAYAVAHIPGVYPWNVTEDGNVERVLPRWPVRMNETGYPLKVGIPNGLGCETICWATLAAGSKDNPGKTDQIVMISLVGSQKKVKAVWAAMMDNKRTNLELPSSQSSGVKARRFDGNGRYSQFWNDGPLPESGLSHIVIELKDNLSPQTGEPFAHIVGTDQVPDLPRLFRQLDLALRLPILEEWMGRIWDLARIAGVIVPIRSYGCQAYWVRVEQDAAWAKIIAQCDGATGPEAGKIEVIGTIHHVSDVEEDADDDEEDDDE